MDASLILLQRIDRLLPSNDILGGQPFMFFNRRWSTDHQKPMLENWLIAAPPKNFFIKKVAREYRLACFGRRKYIKIMSLIYKRKILQDYPPVSYFAFFAAMQVVLLRNKNFTVSMADSEDGPFSHHAKFSYDPELIINALLSEKTSGAIAIKLTSGERIVLDREIAKRGPESSSLLAPLLG